MNWDCSFLLPHPKWDDGLQTGWNPLHYEWDFPRYFNYDVFKSKRNKVFGVIPIRLLPPRYAIGTCFNRCFLYCCFSRTENLRGPELNNQTESVCVCECVCVHCISIGDGGGARPGQANYANRIHELFENRWPGIWNSSSSRNNKKKNR